MGHDIDSKKESNISFVSFSFWREQRNTTTGTFPWQYGYANLNKPQKKLKAGSDKRRDCPGA